MNQESRGGVQVGVEGGQLTAVTALTVVQDPQGLGQHVEQVLLDDGRDVSHPQVSTTKGRTSVHTLYIYVTHVQRNQIVI